jgi:hypothetical protein
MTGDILPYFKDPSDSISRDLRARTARIDHAGGTAVGAAAMALFARLAGLVG